MLPSTILTKPISFAWNIMNRCMSSTALTQMKEVIDEELISIKKAGTWKAERVINTPQAAWIGVKGESSKLLNFCANNYLGLSSHPEVIAAGKEALDSHGAGLSSVRFICGTMDIHINLEKQIAAFHSKDDAILYASCFDANAGLFEALLKPEDAVFSDELNHASIIDGIRLCKAQKYRYKHLNMIDLESQLKNAQDKTRMKLIVTDGVFSMDGDMAPMKRIIELAEKYNALVFSDECHTTGFLGKTGRGIEEYCDIKGKVDIINSTLGKALGGAAGGYTTSCKELTTLLRQKSRPYLFSNSLPPPVVCQASKVMDLLSDGSELCETLAKNTKQFRSKMIAAGFSLSGEIHPIVPVMIGDAKLASEFADEMLEQGIYVIGFSYPVVPKGKARIRVQISALHTAEDIDRCVSAFVNIGKRKGVVS